MKKLLNLVALSLIMLFSVSSFARNSDPVNYASPSINSFIQVYQYKVRIIVQDISASTSGGGYDYSIHAYVYDVNGNPGAPVPIPSSVTIYGSLTISGQTSTITITIPPSGLYSAIQGSGYQLTPVNLQANYLSTYSLGGIPISCEPITFQ